MILFTVEIDKAIIDLSAAEIDDFLSAYPTYKPSSVLLALATLKNEFGKSNQITVEQLLKHSDKYSTARQDEETLRHIHRSCATALGLLNS